MFSIKEMHQKMDAFSICRFFIDINTIFFVTVHELSHIMTEEYGHTKTFWNNMKDLLKISIKNNLYNPIDYSESPVNYCEMDINSTPLDKGDL